MKTLSDRLYGLKKYYSINRLYCIILLAVSMAITPWLLCSCGGRSAAETGQETEMARELGREQALRLRFGIETDTTEIEKILIDVRVREQSLRSRGEDRLADCYVESFLTTLESVNPPLRSLLQE